MTIGRMYKSVFLHFTNANGLHIQEMQKKKYTVHVADLVSLGCFCTDNSKP